ncbi:MAG: NAD-dependent epimerase/dehydratase family protein [Candidatus Liptonbacteria bacterium]|nr:NAD-dependent epimerase/dehydratase family protein [Candidatus Liptonbacteria bacterium]
MTKQSPIRTAGIIGGKGMLGSDLAEFLGNDFETTAIDKDNYGEHCGESFDVLINANGNSQRFFANEHPFEDFEMSTVSVYKTFFDFSFNRYIYISSSDVYNDHSNPAATGEEQETDALKLQPYGFHKYLAEQIVKRNAKRWFIVRSSAILGTRLKKGPVYDILRGNPLWIDGSTRLQFITTVALAEIIRTLLEKVPGNDIFNAGGRGTFDFSGAEETFKKPVSFKDNPERQAYEMNIEKLAALFPLKTSQEYVQEFIKNFQNK